MPSESLSPGERSLRAKLAAHRSWANTTNPSARTAPGRQAFFERFEREVDPLGKLKPEERQRRADSARRAFMAEIALKSARSRRRKP